MVTMLDCIKRVPMLLEQIVSRAEGTFREVLKAAGGREINELYFIGSGTSYTGAYTARYLAEEASGVRVTVALPEDFLYGYSVRNPKALYVFISQTGTSSVTMEALLYCKERGFLTAGVSEKKNTPIAEMWLGIEVGRQRGCVSKAQYEEYERQARAAASHIPGIIEQAMAWMDKSRRRMMKSAFFSFTGAAALSGVAMEAAVKVWEAPQYPSAGYELDEGMHGPNYGYNYNCAVFVLNDGRVGKQKAAALAKYMKNEHGNGYIIGAGALDEKDLGFTPVGGPFESLEFAAAVQVLMYRLAVDGGRDFSILGIHAKMNSYFQSHMEKKTAGENENE